MSKVELLGVCVSLAFLDPNGCVYVCNQWLESNHTRFHWEFPSKNHLLPNKIKLLRLWMRTNYL
jgi:hypothetical protein